jgi:carboxymethylenebutenolidase
LYYESLGGNVNVIAIDMYDGQVATDRETAATLMQGAKEDRLNALVKGAQTYAGKKAKIASVGWCFGGAWSLKSAILTGKQSVGCIMYYGMPVLDIEKLKTLETDVYGIFATEEWISKDIITEFDQKMVAAGESLKYIIYPHGHGFANPSNPKYNKAAADETFAASIKYLEVRFQ